MTPATITYPSGETSPLTDWSVLTEDREKERYDWRRLDNRGRVLGLLEGVEGGSLDLNVNADIRGGGALQWSGRHGTSPVWRDTQVQPLYTATLASGSVVSWPLGVFKCASPGTGYSSSGISADVRLYDRTLLLQRAKLTKDSGVAAGTQVIPYIRSALEGLGITRYVLDDSTETTRTVMVWEAGTSWLRIINDLLDAAGYFGIWADPNGVLRSSKYLHPSKRPHSWAFAEGVKAIHEENIQHEEDDFDVPNRVTAISRGDGYTFELIAEVELDDIIPGHKYSFEKTQEWIDRVEEGLEITSNKVLIAHAERLLRGGLQVASSAGFAHAPLPLELHDRVSLSSSGLVFPSATVQSMGIDCTPGEDWDIRIREVD